MPIWEANWLSRKEKNPLAHTKTAAPWGDTSKNWVISSVHSLILNHKLRSCLCVFEINSFLWLSDCFVLLSKQRYEEIGHFLNITPTVSACNTSHLLFSVEPHPILVMLPIPAFVPICIAHAPGKKLFFCVVQYFTVSDETHSSWRTSTYMLQEIVPGARTWDDIQCSINMIQTWYLIV